MITNTDQLQSSTPAAAAPPLRRATVVAIAAGQRGAGKTNLAVNLAVTLASEGNRVCLLDPDTRHDGATQLLGGRTDISLDAFLTDRIGLDGVMQQGNARIALISAPSALNARNPTQISVMRAALQRLEQDQDYLIINTPANTEAHTLEILGAAQHVLISLLPELESIKSSYSLAWSMVRHGFQGCIQVVVNKVADRAQALSAYRQFKKISERRLGIRVRSLGYVVRDNQLHDAFYHHTPVTLKHPQARSTRCFHGIAEILKQRFALESPRTGFGDRWYGGKTASAPASTVVKLPPRMEENLTPGERFDRLFDHFTAFLDEGGISEERLRQAIMRLENQYEVLFKQPPPKIRTETERGSAPDRLTIERHMDQQANQISTAQVQLLRDQTKGLHYAMESAALLARHEAQHFELAY